MLVGPVQWARIGHRSRLVEDAQSATGIHRHLFHKLRPPAARSYCRADLCLDVHWPGGRAWATRRVKTKRPCSTSSKVGRVQSLQAQC